MILFIGTLILVIVFAVLAVVSDRNDWDICGMFSSMLAFVLSCIFVIMAFFGVFTYVDKPAVEAKRMEQYTSLNERIDNHIYSNVEKNDLAQKVQEWNEDLTVWKTKAQSPWISFYYPESLEGLDFIDLERIK